MSREGSPVSSARYAIYFAPAAKSPWHAFGSTWLGRDDITGTLLPQPAVAGISRGRLATLTAEPCRYGFHGTLKAPFRLRTPSPALLRDAVNDLARRLRAVPLGPMIPLYMDGFVAVVPIRPDAALHALADRVVSELDPLRAPPTLADIARRRPDQLDARGRELLERYGYPLVLERYRFHMTLTGAIDMALAGQVVPHAAVPIARLNAEHPAVLDRLCVFEEASAGAPFRRIHEAVLPP